MNKLEVGMIFSNLRQAFQFLGIEMSILVDRKIKN